MDPSCSIKFSLVYLKLILLCSMFVNGQVCLVEVLDENIFIALDNEELLAMDLKFLLDESSEGNPRD